ncbi:type VI secretion system lipoprotein TssJ [Gilvimarinus japonicus]|uniref:Type VI secretion system lipoprotein TssJ n=1 Tax=Gilvimarinus japonicus TaxID=1796469 RepID=A0ABV7HJP5_9GAMM
MHERIVFTCQKILRLLNVLALVSVCVACASSPKNDSMSVRYVADHGINPDINGRASPVAVTFYRLRDATVFKSADYMTLMERDAELLGDSLLSKERIILRPGETQEQIYLLNGEERAYGIVAGYRSIDAGGWKLVGDMPKARSGFMKVVRHRQSRHAKTIFIGKKSLQEDVGSILNE